MREAFIEWSISNYGPGLTDPNYAITISRFIGATGVLLRFDYSLEGTEISRIKNYIDLYKEAGFSIFLCPLAGKLLTPTDVAEYLNMLNLDGIALDTYIPENPPTKEQCESTLINLNSFCKNAGKRFSYFHGDAFSDVDSTKMSREGIIVWGWWNPPWWKPGTWNLSPIWAQICIWKNSKYSTPSDIIAWYNALPRKPEAIVWWNWLTVQNENPTEEQIQAMQEVTSLFLATPISPLGTLVRIIGPMFLGLYLITRTPRSW